MSHAKLAPSAAERWINCPASVKMSEPFPDTTSVYAAEGTLAHKLAELKVRGQLMGEVIDGNAWDKVIQDNLYSADMQDYTDEYISYIQSVISTQWGQRQPSILTETHLDLSFIAPRTFGTADCLVMYGNELHVIDFKYGKNVEVSATDNDQLKLYALGAVRLFDGLIYNIQNITIHIVQPRMNNFSAWQISKKDLYSWYENTVKEKALAALNGTGEVKNGPWCKFCRAKAVCREYGKPFDVDIQPDDPNVLSNEEIAARITKLEGLDGYIKELKDCALNKALKGEAIPGFKVVEGRSVRAWTNQEEAFNIAQANGYDHSVLYESKPLTLSAVEKMMGKKTFNNLLADYVIKPKGKPTLVKETDKRDPYRVVDSALDDFKDINI